MDVRYNIGKDFYDFKVLKNKDSHLLSTLLTNSKGDFLNLGVNSNSCKFNGLNIVNPKSLDVFKVLDEIVVDGVEPFKVDVSSYKISRYLKSSLAQPVRVVIDEASSTDSVFGEKGKLEYNDFGQLEEVVDLKSHVETRDGYFLGPTGGMIYDIKNYEGSFFLDFDCRRQDDFDEWGREYNVYSKNGVVLVEYKKLVDDKEVYKLFFGIKSQNFSYDLIKDWVKKEYEYSKERKSLFERYVYRLLKVNVNGNKRLFIGSGFTEKEVLDQIFLLEKHGFELENYDLTLEEDLKQRFDFKVPLSNDVKVAYDLSCVGVYQFLNRDIEKIKDGSFAGFPWFSQVWARDDLIGIRSFIELEDFALVKEKIFSYLNNIDEETGLLPRIFSKGSLSSPDACFILAKRIEDFIFALDKKGELSKVLLSGEIDFIYSKLSLIFNRFVTSYWNLDLELFNSKRGDSWMDTLDLNYPLDIQVGFLSFVSSLGSLSTILQKGDDTNKFLDLENLLREKIRSVYFRGGNLYNESNKDSLTCNVFLAYYLYPDLFLKEDWENIVDKTLSHLWLSWGGISSLSKKDKNFVEIYSGENDLSYHRGDSWFWINNLTAIVLHDLNEKKYRSKISKIIGASVSDMLKGGILGFSSEISSAKSLRSQGSLAQFWSQSTFIELVHKIFTKK